MSNNSKEEAFEFCGHTDLKRYDIFYLYLYCAFEYFSIGYRLFVLPLIVLNGMFGNLMSIKIFIKRTDYQATCRIYYLVMRRLQILFI